MLGSINVNRSELKVKELEVYQSWYCGLCHSLKERSGIRGQLTLTYDMTFLSILLSSLYECRLTKKKFFCPLHPALRHIFRRTVYSDYAADMNVLLSYYDMLDDWNDDRDRKRYLMSIALKPHVERISTEYPRQTLAVKEYVSRLAEPEKRRQISSDTVCYKQEAEHHIKHIPDNGKPAAGYGVSRDDFSGIASAEEAASLTGRMLGEIFAVYDDVWADDLRTMGFFLGKYIYLLDAYQDVFQDMSGGKYNPLAKLCEEDAFDDRCKEMLMMQMAECCRAFERLPLVKYTGVLRNILYSGVWISFAGTYRQRNGLDHSEENKKRFCAIAK